MSGLEVPHEDWWLQLAEDFTKQCRVKEKAINAQRWNDGRSPEEVSIEGSLGEWAAAAYFGAPLNLDIARGNDGGIDFAVSGLTFDTKTTRYRSGAIVACKDEPEVSDVLVLAIVTPCSSILAGWVSRRRFQVERMEKDMGYGPRWVMEQDRLSHVRDLRATIGAISTKESV